MEDNMRKGSRVFITGLSRTGTVLTFDNMTVLIDLDFPVKTDGHENFTRVDVPFWQVIEIISVESNKEILDRIRATQEVKK
jgi:hypothetical protein